MAESFIKAGWELAGDKLPTFTTSRHRPAGLWQCQPWEVSRWQQDLHRYPPYVYRDKHGLVNSTKDWRLPSIQEKEVAMGFPLDYTS